MVFYEETIGSSQLGINASQAAFGYRALMLACCARLSIPLEGYAPSTVKKYFTGNGRAQKDDMIFEVGRRFKQLEVADDNEADAVAILCYGMSVKYQIEAI